MDWSHFEHLMEMSDAGRLDEAIREGQALLAEADNECRKASALVLLSRFAEALPILLEAVGFDFEEVSDEPRCTLCAWLVP